MHRILAAGILALSLTPVALAQAPAARFHYDGEMVITPASGHVALDWTIRVQEDDIEAVTFLLSPSFQDVRITGDDVAGVTAGELETFSGPVPAYTVALHPGGNADGRQISIGYAGILLPEPMETRINTVEAGKVELTVDSFWMPFDTRFTSLVTADIEIELAGEDLAGWSGVGIETLVPAGGGFYLEQTRPALDVAFTLTSRSERIEADGYVIHDMRAEPGAGIDAVSGALGFCTGYLNALAGPGGPLPHAAVTVNDRSEAGYSRGTLIALTDIADEDPVSLYQFICHELAHYWSRGNALTVENWLNEGIADTMANMAVRDAFGEDAYEARLEAYRSAVEASPDGRGAVWTPAHQERPPYVIMYRKAPLVMARLEARVGRDMFARIMRAYAVEAVATTPALLELVEREVGADARAGFEAMLAGED